ncbi:Uncharacterised protein [uncultured archaeon]|nr:Uncharacterised protein [uncultured archaeon]
MKKIQFVFLAIILIFVNNAYAQSEGMTQFNVTSVVSVPHLTPGDRNIGIEFTLLNNQDAPANKINIHLFLRYPFSASLSSNNKLGELSYPGYLIGTSGSGDEYTPYFDLGPYMSQKTFFKIDVDRNAKYGKYDIPYTIFYDTDKEFNGKITLQIMGDTLVEIKNFSVATNGSKVEPGEAFKAVIEFENVGDNEIKWLKIKLNPMDKSLVPVSSSTEHIFKDIPQGLKKESEFLFSIEKDAPAKNYQMELILNYMDERGIEYNETKLMGIVAAGRAKLDIAKKTTEPARIKENEPFTLTIKIENTGTGDAKGVTASIESALEGDTLAYLGEIKKDDYSNAIFTINPASSGKVTGILRISYEDDFGTHEIQKDLIVIVNPADRQSSLPIILGMIAVSGGIYFWRRKR